MKTIELNPREALLIVTALGTYQNRIGQKASWLQRKRMNLLRSRLADAITIGDSETAQTLRHAISHTERRIRQTVNYGLEISYLREWVKQETGITNETINDPTQDE